MDSNHSIRPLFIIGFLACVGMIAVALYAQHVMLLEPCPICIFQRIAVMVLGVIFLIGLLHNPSGSRGRRVYGQLVVLASLAGIGLAGWHSWLQRNPPDHPPECGAGLSYWLDNLPPSEVLSKVFAGTGECSQVSWSMLGLSIPEWTLLAFVVFCLYGFKVLIKGH